MIANSTPASRPSAVRTDDVDVADRLDFWTDAISQTYVSLDCTAPDGGRSLQGQIDSHSLAQLGVSHVRGTPQHVIRTPRGISRAADDFFLVSVQLRGCGLIVQDDRAATLNPGDFALYDTTRPYQLLFDDQFAQFVLMLPGASLRTVVDDAADLTARTVSGRRGAGRLLVDMIDTIMTDEELGPTSAEAVARSVEYLLIAGLTDLAGRDDDGGFGSTERLERIKKAIMFRLHDPDLSVASLAEQLHMSVSSIHRAFAGEAHTPAEWMWAQRLDGVRRDLEDSRYAHQTIGYLASRWGFVDSAHFSRAFKNRFGSTPSHCRNGRR